MLIYLLYIRKKAVILSQIIDQLAFCLFFQNHLNVFYMSKQIAILKVYFQNIREDFEKNLAPNNIHYQQSLKSAFLVDLPKASGCVVHDFVMAKLSAYGFDNNSLKPINNFFGCRKFMTEIVSSYCSYLALVGVPQGSILDP